MVQNPPAGAARISPYLYYRDVKSAMDWLARAFGLESRLSMSGPDDSIAHAEMAIADGLIMLGPASGRRGTQSPKDLSGVTQSLYVYVDDVDAHFMRAKTSGAAISSELQDMFWGDRIYSARDPEGHLWTFAQHVRDVKPEEMRPPG